MSDNPERPVDVEEKENYAPNHGRADKKGGKNKNKKGDEQNRFQGAYESMKGHVFQVSEESKKKKNI